MGLDLIQLFKGPLDLLFGQGVNLVFGDTVSQQGQGNIVDGIVAHGTTAREFFDIPEIHGTGGRLVPGEYIRSVPQ